jgi:DGQHR domain-containing protein
MSALTVDYIPVTQPVGTFYLTSIRAGTLLSMADILSRDMTEEGRKRVQREYSEDRGKEIALYATEDNATFPTSIIVAVYADCAIVDEQEKKISFGCVQENGEWQSMDIQQPFKIGEVIDGQHRLLGLRRAINDDGRSELANFELPVVFMLDLSQGDKAYVFSIINSKQRSVSSSLIMDLFGLQEGRSPYKTCHEIAQAFYDWTDDVDGKPVPGPFYRSLKMLGKKVEDGEMLSQGSFGKYVLKLISRTPDQDMRKLRRDGEDAVLEDDLRCRLRYFFLQKKDHVIARILHEYFSAIRDTFPVEWGTEREKYLLRKTVGFSALIHVFDAIWERGKISNYSEAAIFFREKAGQFKANLSGVPLTSDTFPSSEKGALMIANKMLGK